MDEGHAPPGDVVGRHRHPPRRGQFQGQPHRAVGGIGIGRDGEGACRGRFVGEFGLDGGDESPVGSKGLQPVEPGARRVADQPGAPGDARGEHRPGSVFPAGEAVVKAAGGAGPAQKQPLLAGESGQEQVVRRRGVEGHVADDVVTGLADVRHRHPGRVAGAVPGAGVRLVGEARVVRGTGEGVAVVPQVVLLGVGTVSVALVQLVEPVGLLQVQVVPAETEALGPGVDVPD